MKLSPVKANMTEVEIGNKTILFSYKTPVAYHEAGVGYFKTDKKWSQTTTRHINQWLPKPQDEFGVEEVTQAFLDRLV